MSLPLLGLGEVEFEGKDVPASEVLKKFGWEPIELQSKEGLALLNGTQFMSAFGVWCVVNARRLSECADKIGAMSLDAFDGRIEPFYEPVHKVRAHRGQLETARNFRELLKGSELIARHKEHVQDPYSFRCIPQVHGASKDTIDYVESVITTEINSVTDNPTVFPDEDIVISAGNFHGQPIAVAMDFLAIAVSELGNISERRTYKLISGSRGLPSFLVANPGLNSGFMIPQYTAASIVSQSKGLCMPASADSIPSSQGQEGAGVPPSPQVVARNRSDIRRIPQACSVHLQRRNHVPAHRKFGTVCQGHVTPQHSLYKSPLSAETTGSGDL